MSRFLNDLRDKALSRRWSWQLDIAFGVVLAVSTVEQIRGLHDHLHHPWWMAGAVAFTMLCTALAALMFLDAGFAKRRRQGGPNAP